PPGPTHRAPRAGPFRSEAPSSPAGLADAPRRPNTLISIYRLAKRPSLFESSHAHTEAGRQPRSSSQYNHIREQAPPRTDQDLDNPSRIQRKNWERPHYSK